jgi:pyruvate-formate lyase-activating enzyme
MIFDEICVLANGDIVCSCGDPSGKKVYGNVHRDRIAEVYEGADYRGMRRWQLADTQPSSWCPVIDQRCGGRVSRPRADDAPSGRRVRMLQLEPVSHCNLACPACPVTQFERDPSYRPDRGATLPLETMLDVVDQLPDLEKILFYNFGEPFLHPRAIDFLREVRKRRPEVEIHTSTNGLAFTEEKLHAIAEERLLDRIVFSIDGATQASYSRYRIGGELERVLASLQRLVRLCESAGTRDRIEILWQYILFDWNDGEPELERARELAADFGVPLTWIVTHTHGASSRFRPGSLELRNLLGSDDAWVPETCDLRAVRMDESGGVVDGRYLAQLTPDRRIVRSRPRDRFAVGVRIENRSREAWIDRPGREFRLAAQLRGSGSMRPRTLPFVPLPAEVRPPGGTTDLVFDTLAPAPEGPYELLLDIVEEGVSWFHERGSAPATLRLEVDSAVSFDPPVGRLDQLCRNLLGRGPAAPEIDRWSSLLSTGLPHATLLEWIAGSAPFDIPVARRSAALRDLRSALLQL